MGRVLCHASQTRMFFPLRWRPLTAATFFLSNDGNINRCDLQPSRIKTSSSGQACSAATRRVACRITLSLIRPARFKKQVVPLIKRAD
jgi:hypothetical protein